VKNKTTMLLFIAWGVIFETTNNNNNNNNNNTVLKYNIHPKCR